MFKSRAYLVAVFGLFIGVVGSDAECAGIRCQPRRCCSILQRFRKCCPQPCADPCRTVTSALPVQPTSVQRYCKKEILLEIVGEAFVAKFDACTEEGIECNVNLSNGIGLFQNNDLGDCQMCGGCDQFARSSGAYTVDNPFISPMYTTNGVAIDATINDLVGGTPNETITFTLPGLTSVNARVYYFPSIPGRGIAFPVSISVGAISATHVSSTGKVHTVKVPHVGESDAIVTVIGAK